MRVRGWNVRLCSHTHCAYQGRVFRPLRPACLASARPLSDLCLTSELCLALPVRGRPSPARLAGQPSAVWLTVAMEGRLESDPREEPGFIEAVGGRIYELASPSVRAAAAREAPLPPAAAAASSAAASATSLAEALTLRLPYAAVGVLLAGVIGFGAGTSMAPPPPPPPPPRVTKVFIAPAAAPKALAAKAEGGAAGSGRITSPLTVQEQRERAELRVDRDKAKLQMMQQRIKEDEQLLSEYRRVEAQRGGDADAVRLIFPDQFGPGPGIAGGGAIPGSK